MTAPFSASANASGGRIDLRCAIEKPLPVGGSAPDRPALRIVRREYGFPADASDGVVVVDLTDVFRTTTAAWERLEQHAFRTTNTTDGDGALEGDVVLFFSTPQPSEATRVRLRFYDPVAQAVTEDVIDDGSRVDRTSAASAPWQNVERLEFFHTPGGGPEVSAGVLRIFTGNANPAVANHVEWAPAAGPVRAIDFDVSTHRKADHTEATVLTFETRVLDTDVGTPWLTVASTSDEDTGVVTWQLDLRDGGLDTEVQYYYRAYEVGTAAPLGEDVALATNTFDSPNRLFLRLPGAWQRADEPDPTTPTGAPGPVRRFLQPVGDALDLARSVAESTRDRHDVHAVRVDLLPRLARMIGWAPDLTATAETQRRDIASAPEIFGSVGTIPNVQSLVNRVTSWPVQVKEFVNNVFLTNAPERIRLWELWSIRNDGTAFNTPSQLTITTDVHARPALAVDGAGTMWMFYEADTGGRREIFRQRLDGVDAAPVAARAGTSDDTPTFSALDQDSATAWDGTQIWLFFSSNREGQWDIWARTFDNTATASDVIRLTDHAADDTSPAAVHRPGPPNQLWLFWSSRRRGPADIWTRVLDLGTGVWSNPTRVTDSPLRDDRPAAAVDSTGKLWLFWTRDDGGRQTLWFRTFDGTTWSAESALDVGHARDESPAVVAWKTGVFLLWHSDAEGPWQIWGRINDGTVWHAATLLSASVQGNKEPAAAIDSPGGMRVVWRSQRRARRYRSRTLDFTDPQMLAEMGTFEDRGHYTYDTGLDPNDWYARGTVGLYLTPDTHDAAKIAAAVDRATSFIEPFRAAPVRYTWPMGDIAVEETVDVGALVGEAWSNAP